MPAAADSVLNRHGKGVQGPFLSGSPSKSKQNSVRFLSIKPIIDNRPLVRDHLKRTSVVYAKKTPPFAGTRLGQRQVNELRLRSWARYNWTLPPLPPGRPSLTCAKPPVPSPSSHPRDADEGDNCVETTRSLPPLRLSALGQPMLRRPTTQCSARSDVGVGDELMSMLGNYLDLVPVSGQSQSGHHIMGLSSVAFYNQHFPLIMQTGRCNEDQEGSNKVVSHRQMMNRQTNDQNRKADLNTRCQTLERALTSLERGSGDTEESDHSEEGGFVTELREDAFDPRSWPWNEGRYQA